MHHPLFRKLGTVFVWLVFATQVIAQGNYPVRILPFVNYPVSSSLQDYSTAMRVPVKVNLQLQDLTLGARNVFLKVGIQGPGIDIRSGESAALVRVTLTPGMLLAVPAAQLSQYFSPANLLASPALFTRPLPAGLYTFSFEVYDELTRVKLSDRVSSPPVWIETSQPPIPILPQNNAEVAVSQVQNVLFQWTPRHTQINDVEYEFIITELPVTNRGNIQNIFLSQPPLYKGIVKENNFLYGAKFPPLREGYTYAWRVQAKPKFGKEQSVGTFVNDGIGEIFSFTYISTLKYPTEVRAAWGSDFKNLGVTWKGDDAHQRYVISLQNGTQVIKEYAIDKSFGNQYTYNIPNLSATTPYTVVIRGIDRFSRTGSASPVSVKANALADVQKRLQTTVELKGSVKWAFLASEEKVSVKDNLLDNTTGYMPLTRTTTQTRVSPQLAGTAYPLKDATVALYGASSALDISSTPSWNFYSRASLLGSAKSSENGEYRFDNLRVAQLAGYTHFYIIVRYKDNSLSQRVAEVKIDEQQATQRNLGLVTLAANTVRYAPKIRPTQGKLDISQFEEIALYRLKPVFDANKTILTGEAGGDSPTELTYNNATYVKVKELLQNGGQLFDNQFVRDNFVLAIKQKGRQRVVYPISQTAASNAPADITTITDRFMYTPPQVVVQGLVAFGTKEKNQKAPGHGIGVLVPRAAKDLDMIEKNGKVEFPQSIPNYYVQLLSTDNSGKFSIKLPDNITNNKEIKRLVLFAADPTTSKVHWAKVIDKPLEDIKEDFYLQASAATVAGVVTDQYNRPVKSAFVTHSGGASAQTDDNGLFVLHTSIAQDFDKDPRLTIKADDYKTLTASISNFTKTKATPGTDLGYRFWSEGLQKFTTAAKVELGELANEEVFNTEFKAKNAGLEVLYTQQNLVMESVEIAVRIKGALKDKPPVAFSAAREEESLEIPAEGTTLYVKAGELTLYVKNADDAATLYMEDTLTTDVQMPNRLGTVVDVKLTLREAIKIGGTVIGKSLDGKTRKPLEGATVSLGDAGGEAESDKEGKFEILIEKGAEDVAVEATLKGYNKEEFSLKPKEKTADELKNLEIELEERDKNIPDFETLQGFAIELDVAKKVSDSYEISGKITLEKNDGAAFNLAEDNELTFTKLMVREDKKNSSNALVEGKWGKLNEKSVDLELFGYVATTLDSDDEPLRIQALTGAESKGKISGKAMMFAPEKFLGSTPQAFLSEIELTLEDNKQPMFDAFVSDDKIALPTTDMGAEFTLTFPEGVKAKHLQGGWLPIQVGTSNIYRLDMSPDGVTINEKGINFSKGGNFRFPLMQQAGLKAPAKISKLRLKPNADLDLREVEFQSRDKYYFEMPIGGWIFKVGKFQIMDNFKRFGVGGDLFLDDKSYLIVNTFNVTKSGGKFYPSMSLNFSKEGLKMGSLTLKNSGEQEIAVRYKEAEGETPGGYEVDAGAIMYCSAKNAVTDKIFPLEVERFLYNTAGGVYVSIKPGRAIPIGPVKVNVRKLIFNKGTEEGWHDMMNSLASTDPMSFGKGKKKVVANYDSFKMNGEGYIPDAILRPADVEWAFGFAGGVQIEQLKGAKFKSDVVMVVGDKGSGVEAQFGAIELGLEQSAFTAFAKIKLATSGDRVGFEGQGRLETMKTGFDAGLKFYKLPSGIEFGAHVVVSSLIATGPVTWTKMGGGVDFNTQESKYKVMFLGEATPTGTPREVTSFRNINVSVLFDTQACGAKPIVEGRMDWFNKNEFFCNAYAKLDFCRMLVLGTINCDKEIFQGSMAKINATVFFSTKSLFLGASVRTQVLSADLNGSLMLGVENNFYSSTTPQEAKAYANSIRRDYLDNGGSTLNGIYLRVYFDQRGYSSGNYWIASYSVNTVVQANAELLYAWKQNNFFLKAGLNAEAQARFNLLGAGLNGDARLYVNAEGGRNNRQGWYLDAGAGLNISVWNDGGGGNGCNSMGTKWCNISMPCGLDCCCGRWWRPRLPRCSIKWCNVGVPCGINFKLCLNGSLRANYQQYHSNGWQGWRLHAGS